MPFRRSLLHAAALAMLLVAPAGASAASPNTNTVVTDGAVNATVFDTSGRAYIGGDFSRTGPRLGNGIALTLSSDTPAPGFPEVNGTIRAAVSDGAGGWFIGGDFNMVGGVARSRLAHIRADRTLDPDWNPGANRTVRALAMSSSGASVYVGGDFFGANAIGGQARGRIAKLSASGTGAVDTTFAASIGAFTAGPSVLSIAASDTAVYIGGRFGSVNHGEDVFPRQHLAKLASSDGAVHPTWDPSAGGLRVTSLALSGAELFVGGEFSTIGGQSRVNLAKVASDATGAADATWDPNISFDPRALQVVGSSLFVGSGLGLSKHPTTGTGALDTGYSAGLLGSVDSLGLVNGELLVGGSFGEVAGTGRRNLARLTTANPGTATAWNPSPFGPVLALAVSGSDIFAGGEFASAGPAHEVRGGLIRLNANGSLDESFDPDVEGPVRSLALDGSDLFVGGGFTRVKGTTRAFIAKVGTAGGALDSTWNPGASATVNALAVSGSRLFAGGEFNGPASIGGQDRSRIAKLSTTGVGAVDTTWNPGSNGDVLALAVSGNDLFTGGFFSNTGGQNRVGLAKLSTEGVGSGDATWQPPSTGFAHALVVSGSSLYAGSAGGLKVDKVATTGAGDSDPAWSLGANGTVRALALAGGALYAGGDFSVIRGQPRSRMARLSPDTGAVDPGFNPAGSTNGGSVNAIAATANRVVAGGSFNSVGPHAIANLAVFNLGIPTVTVTTPTEGARYRQGQEVLAGFSCADPDGPVDSVECSGNVPSGAAIDTGSAGAKTFTVTARDAAGNTATKVVNYTVDGTPPSISIGSPADGASYAPGTKVAVDYACIAFDVIDDVASCVGTSPVGTELDTLTPGPHTFTVTASDKVGNVAVRTVNYVVTAAGASNGDDILNGTAAADTICGLFGNDRINGLAGNDKLFGDNCNDRSKAIAGAQSTTEGNDRIHGGDGNDTIYGAGGKDTLGGDKGADKVFGGGGNDTLTGGDGNDTLDGGKGKDSLDGGKGNDKLTGGADVNKLKGGAGDDTINAKNGKVETVDCGSGKKDSASVDKRDKVKGCEKVKRAKK